MTQGAFITLEGIEGAGKSTCMAQLRLLMQQAGKYFLETREPGGTQLGEDLRALLLGHKHTGMSDDTELLLMFASRAEHLQQKILPALNKGHWVLCDRFTDATYAYQGGGRGIAFSRIQSLEDWVQQGLKPDLTLLLDLPVEQGLERAGKRSAPDRFESEAMSFFKRVRQSYLDLSSKEPERIKVIDASLELNEVLAQITNVMDDFLQQKG
ncbi:MAG TPA: dTMP kinase [Thiolapillus brandeum]|uniref:Thymidylate kinase n=1 Tax=Thiolapillus brandeum TaxID=1076588 RepID=A0A831KAW0_9GAMM|nr:dTMP kinase [Thiolapillus brandeum]